MLDNKTKTNMKLCPTFIHKSYDYHSANEPWKKTLKDIGTVHMCKPQTNQKLLKIQTKCINYVMFYMFWYFVISMHNETVISS